MELSTMKNIIRLILSNLCFILLFIPLNTYFLQAQEQTPSMKAWSVMLDKPQLAEFFHGMFENLGIRVEETGEEFTVHHLGNSFSMSAGIDENGVDYIADIKLENVKNMMQHGADEKIDPMEAHRIVSVLFTPLTKVTLKNPIMSNGFLRWISGVENLIHVNLINPDESVVNSHTLIFTNREWLVITGLHGSPKRVYRIDVDQAVEYQKTVFKTFKTNTWGSWWKFRKWYRQWRKDVSVNF